MMKSITHIDFEDISEGLPAFISIISMVFSYSIATGISWGVMSWCICKIASRKIKEIPVITWILFAVFLLKTVMDIWQIS